MGRLSQRGKENSPAIRSRARDCATLRQGCSGNLPRDSLAPAPDRPGRSRCVERRYGDECPALPCRTARARKRGSPASSRRSHLGPEVWRDLLCIRHRRGAVAVGWRINSSSLARLKTASSPLPSSAGRAGSTVSAKSASRRCEFVTNSICCEPRKQEVAVAELLDHGAAHRIIALRRPAAGRVGQAPAVGPSHDVTPQASVWLLSRHIVCLFSCLHD